MKRIIFIALIAALLFFALKSANKTEAPVPALSEQEQVQTVVKEFGEHLKNVPLAAESELVRTSIEKEYRPYASAVLMDRWLDDPAHAPGREVSSPWPERIEIKSIQKVGEYCEIEGEIVYLTSTGESGRSPVFLTAAFLDEKWLIAEYQTSME